MSEARASRHMWCAAIAAQEHRAEKSRPQVPADQPHPQELSDEELGAIHGGLNFTQPLGARTSPVFSANCADDDPTETITTIRH